MRFTPAGVFALLAASAAKRPAAATQGAWPRRWRRKPRAEALVRPCRATSSDLERTPPYRCEGTQALRADAAGDVNVTAVSESHPACTGERSDTLENHGAFVLGHSGDGTRGGNPRS